MEASGCDREDDWLLESSWDVRKPNVYLGRRINLAWVVEFYKGSSETAKTQPAPDGVGHLQTFFCYEHQLTKSPHDFLIKLKTSASLPPLCFFFAHNKKEVIFKSIRKKEDTCVCRTSDAYTYIHRRDTRDSPLIEITLFPYSTYTAQTIFVLQSEYNHTSLYIYVWKYSHTHRVEGKDKTCFFPRDVFLLFAFYILLHRVFLYILHFSL